MSKLSKYASARFRKLRENLQAYAGGGDAETLHQVRVEIKKLKAALEVTGASLKKFHPHRNFVPLREIFRKAGTVWEPEALSGLILRYGIPGSYEVLVKQTGIESATQRFKDKVPHFLTLTKDAKDRLRKHFKKVNGADIRRYLKEKKKTLRALLQSKSSGKTLHQSRKAIKEIVYLSSVTGKTKAKLDPFYEKIEELIGQWHDKQVLAALLKKAAHPEWNRLIVESRADMSLIRNLISSFNKQART